MITRTKGFFFIIAVFVGELSCENKKPELSGYDYRLFEDTPVWELAQAVGKQDSSEITRIAKEGDVDINYQESRFGNTVLILAVRNQHFTSCKTLLTLGADPNIHDNYSGSTALIDAAEIADVEGDNSVFIRLLLDHDADPNREQTGARIPGNTIRMSPLLAACRDIHQWGSPIEKVKALVEAGANVNYEDEFGNFPLKPAVFNEHYDVVLYLLQKGVDHERMIVDRGKFQDQGQQMYLADMLREDLFPLGSREHVLKMAVVDFLKTKGIDYRKIPIPDFVVQEAKTDYPGNWQEYLEKY